MTKRKWIGLVGRAGVGKDYTFSQINRIDPQAVRISFADGVRLEIETSLRSELPILWKKPYSDSVRRLLQWWGTDYRRDKNPEYWVEYGERVALGMQAQSAGAYPVFTDVRFQNEADLIRKHNGILVRVVASDATRQVRLGELPPEHASESESDAIQCDWQIVSETFSESYEETLQGILKSAGFNGWPEATG